VARAPGAPRPVKRSQSELSLKGRAMRFLARREHSRAELRAKLLPHVQENEDVDAVLDELEKHNWLSDVRAAGMMIDARRVRFGIQRIVHELRQKGIAEHLIDQAIPQLKETEFDTAREVWQKRFGVFPRDQNEKAKQVRFMQSRGFGLDVIFKVLKFAGSVEDEKY
jgi:regulatory protein